MDCYKESPELEKKREVKFIKESENLLKTKEIQDIVRKVFDNLDCASVFSDPKIAESLSFIFEQNETKFGVFLDEIKNYDFINQLFSDYMSLENRELAVKCLEAMNIFLEIFEETSNEEILHAIFEKIHQLESEDTSEVVALIESLSFLLNEETFSSFEYEDCSLVFSLTKSYDNDSDVTDAVLSFAFNFIKYCSEEKDLPKEIVFGFLELYVDWFCESPVEQKKKEKASIIDFAINSIDESSKIIEKAVPFLYSMGFDVYPELFSVLKALGPSSAFYQMCSPAVFDSITSYFQEPCFIPAVSLLDKCLCESKEAFQQIWLKNKLSLKLISSSLAKEIVYCDAGESIFSCRLLCLLIINFPSDFLEINPWKCDDNESGEYSLCAAIKKAIELGDDILILAASSIKALHDAVKLQNESMLDDFCSTMHENGIIDALGSSLEATNQDDKKFIEMIIDDF